MLITKMQWQGYGFFSLELTEPSRFEAYEHFIVQASNPCVYWLSGSGLCPNITRANEAETVRFRAGELTGENVGCSMPEVVRCRARRRGWGCYDAPGCSMLTVLGAPRFLGAGDGASDLRPQARDGHPYKGSSCYRGAQAATGGGVVPFGAFGSLSGALPRGLPRIAFTGWRGSGSVDWS